MTDDGNAEQIRAIIAEAVKQANLLAHTEMEDKAVFPMVLKWVAGIVAILVGAAVIAYFNWLTTSVNQMQVTLARMDERQSGEIEATDSRYQELDRRVTRLETQGHSQ